MKITVPIYIQKQSQKGATPQMHILRPLFDQEIEALGDKRIRKQYAAIWERDSEVKDLAQRISNEKANAAIGRAPFAAHD